MTLVDPGPIAELLGVPQEAVCKLQRHGVLRRLDLDQHELRRRLWRGHLAHLPKGRVSGKDNHLE